MPGKIKIDREKAEKIQQLQLLEQNLQNLMLQKQAFQLESGEINGAIDEVKASKDDVYKIIGSVMVKSKKEILSKELLHKKEILDLRVKSIEKQGTILKDQLMKVREEAIRDLK